MWSRVHASNGADWSADGENSREMRLDPSMFGGQHEMAEDHEDAKVGPETPSRLK